LNNHSDSTSAPPSARVFAEPWQARAFALAIKLSERGYFTPKEWTAALARKLSCSAAHGEVDDGSHYYEHWLTALEALAVEKGLTDNLTLVARKEAWRNAYQRTPHGNAVELLSD
jgi:nitrile hydratase accessory protein